jgi:hypothetical protein
MKKKVVVKAVSIAAASAVLLISTYGCSVMKRVYNDMESAMDGLSQDCGAPGTAAFGGSMQAVAETAYTLPGIFDEAGVAGATAVESTLAEGDSFYEEKLEDYVGYGIEYSSATGEWWMNDKPLAGIYDPENYTMTNSTYLDVGAFVLVARGEDGEIKDVSEVGKEEFAKASGLSGYGTLQESAKSRDIIITKRI